MAEITIKVGNVKIEASRSDIREVNETPDGVVFSFQGGIQIVYNDSYMPSSTKQIIKNTADTIKTQKIIFELDNPKRPVFVDAT
ncbi:MAG: hypothetical protein ACFFG0_01705 [Candidatus Thorarchaeota archaeon]